MKTRQINVTVGVKIPVGYGQVRYEVTEFLDLDEDEDRDQALLDKRNELTTHVYNHATKMSKQLAADEQARAAK